MVGQFHVSVTFLRHWSLSVYALWHPSNRASSTINVRSGFSPAWPQRGSHLHEWAPHLITTSVTEAPPRVQAETATVGGSRVDGWCLRLYTDDSFSWPAQAHYISQCALGKSAFFNLWTHYQMTFPALLIVGVSLDCVRGEGFFQFAGKKKMLIPLRQPRGKGWDRSESVYPVRNLLSSFNYWYSHLKLLFDNITHH